ncbi:glycosyltransferase family 4 protein [Dechloromonas sp. XY25]|uniref:Glycosyltransferase family 4 protein n=1 Tax=Dechloromonas hankyongensis TaxID=2908002 RepID=A0ABS9JZL0_9RHOO|nr:glycosyltransferase family 4 protein [Dechloromonas hankyongensis]MCG2576279.1 glycosyltransferase family 4 protein [Dechloromonas hankyongensis]
MKVVVVYQYYQGCGAPGHSLVYELTQFLAERGHDVTVVSGETGYMERNVPTLPWYRRIIRRECDGKVNVVRTYTYSELHRSYLGRLLSFISFSLSCPLGLLTVHKPDVVLASSPPIFPMFPAWLICKLRRIPFVMEVRDLWPASAIQMGILKNRQLIGVMAWMERVLYNQSAKIVALTQGIRDDICARGWPKAKVELVTCGVDFDKLYSDAPGAAFIRDKFGWQDKKIILYFGALGEANNISVTLRAAHRLQSRQDIIFVLIGDGMKRIETEGRISELGLKNLLVLPPVPKDDARLYINAADLCLVTLRNIPLFDGAIPTKLIDYMACGKAVLCGIRGEAERIINDAGAGAIFEPDNDEQLSNLVLDLLSDKTRVKKMEAGGLAYVQNRFSAVTMRQQMESILRSVANSDHSTVVAEGS